MKKLGLALGLVGALALVVPAFGHGDSQEGHGRVVVTILPSGSGDHVTSIAPQNVKIKLDGEESNTARITPLRAATSPIELVLLIDGSARTSLGQQFNDINTFVKEMPTNAKIGIAYMENGQAVMAGPLSANPDKVMSSLRLPAGTPGSNASPYFCLSDLAKQWPSNDPAARRTVVMITNGVDNYERRLDFNDPYVQEAINDSVRAGIVVYSMYWQDVGTRGNSLYEASTGQNLLFMVTQATGGHSYWQGIGNPVSFGPYFDDLRRRLSHQYELSFTAPFNGKPKVMNLKVELRLPSAKVELRLPSARVDAPQKALVGAEVTTSGE